MIKKARKQRLINKTLARHEKFYDENFGTIIINDFMQLSNILERLRESDQPAFTAMFALIEENAELKEEVRERGQHIAKLQKGQTQPK